MDKIAAEAAAKSAKELAKMLEGLERIDLIDYRLLLPFFQSALSQSLAEREQRIATLRTALKHEVDNCVNCSGTGRYVTHREGGYEFTVTCERCTPGRAALAATDGASHEVR